jgi:hypothetical protein
MFCCNFSIYILIFIYIFQKTKLCCVISSVTIIFAHGYLLLNQISFHINFISATSKNIRALSTLQHVITWIHSLLSGDPQTTFTCPCIDTMLTSQQFNFPVQILPFIFRNRFFVIRSVPSLSWI